MGSDDLGEMLRFDAFTLDLARGALLAADGAELPLLGLTADLVTDLARFQTLRVVAPGRRTIRPEERPDAAIGAVYLVGGSVRRAGGRIRVTAQLEDAASGVHLWAERFDRPLDDLFAVQEELAERLATQVDHEGLRASRRRPPQGLTACDLYLRGRELFYRTTEADTLLAHEMFDRAIEADPDYALAYAWQAFTVQRGLTHLRGEPRGRAAVPLALALALAQRAVEIEPEPPASCSARCSCPRTGPRRRWPSCAGAPRV